MKVIHILHELKFSGAEIMYVDAAESFTQKGCKLTVVATANNLGEYAPHFKKASYEVLHLPYPPISKYWKRLLYFQSFIFFLKNEKFNVVHIHSHGAMWGFSLCAWLAGVKSVYTFHNVFPSGNFTYPYHFFRRWTAKNIFHCQFHTISDSVFNHEYKYYHNSSVKIYNWYGNKRFYPALEGEKSKFRAELGIDENAFVLISVGGCSHVKQHDEIIKALQILQHQIPNCIYLHLGTGTTEEEEIKLVEKLNLTKYVKFLGNQIDIRRHLIAADAYLMTSKFEGMPITTIEAMACKVAAILYDVPGLRDFNIKGKICNIIPPNYLMLASEIFKLYNSKMETKQLAEKAELMMNDLYNLETNSKAIFNLYDAST